MVINVSQNNILKSIKFKKKKLASIIQIINLERFKFSGYLQVKFDDSQESEALGLWYLFFARGRIVFSDFQPISFSTVLDALKNYIPSLRSNELNTQAEIQNIIHRANTETDTSMVRLFSELTLNKQLLDYREFAQAIKSHILAESEKYLFDYSGEAKLVFDKTIDKLRPIIGFEVEPLILTLRQRKKLWERLESVIPSMDYQVRCNTQSHQWKQLPEEEKRKITRLVDYGKTLEEIRYNLGEDSFKVARTFSKLIQQELVVIGAESNDFASIDQPPVVEETPESLAPEIVIVDDSPVLLKQFTSVATGLGYRVRCCDDALAAVDFVLESEPVVIFLDVNMPNLSGFQLMKQIRLQPKLSSIPLVILTAEKTIMNQQRAKWSKSKFLSKPLNSEDSQRFVSELKTLLQTLAPITQ